MSKKPARIILSVAIIGGALCALLYATLSGSAEYYKHVDEVMTNPQQWYGKSLQLHGFVVDNSVERKPDSLDWRFQVQNNGKVVTATYEGVVPDTFKGGAEVVLNGRLGKDGFHVAPDGVMAKCPSKYNPQNVGAAGAGEP